MLALGKCQVLRGKETASRLHPGSVFGGLAVLGISQTRKELYNTKILYNII